MRRVLILLVCGLLLLSGVAQAMEFIYSDDEDYTPAIDEGGGAAPQDAQMRQDALAADTAGPVEILITAAGDVTLGGNMRKNPSSNMYTKLLAARDGDLSYFFANVYDIFSQDDLTLVNFEGTLTNTTDYKQENEFCFRAPPEHIEVLTSSSIEAVAFENNHVRDFKQAGYDDTISMFTQHDIVYSAEDHVGVYETKGVSIAMLAYQTFNGAYPRLLEEVPQAVAAAKAQHDIVIVSYHWGAEKDYKPNENQIKLGRATVDAGADLVLGHHSHRLNPIEQYNGKYIVYSLGNCSFSGHTGPDDMDTFLFQQRFYVQDGIVMDGGFRVIPCSISSISGKSGAESADNDLAVTPFAPDSKAFQRVLDKLQKHGESLTYAVQSYPTEW